MSGPEPASVQAQQELVYGSDHDYREGSPHLKHRRLNQALLGELRAALAAVEAQGLPLTVLEIGAGDGAFVEPLLSYGCTYTATEMSRPSIATMTELFGRNPGFEALFDPDGSLGALGERRFSLILFASVLHHIPDYEAALERAAANHLSEGGALISVQDPLWYPRLGRARHAVSELAYLSWRLGRGDVVRGVATRLRRLRGVYRDDNPSDVVEYHVVRDGVDEDAVVRLLERRFAEVRLFRYWSTPGELGQRLGTSLGMDNTFAVVALRARART